MDETASSPQQASSSGSRNGLLIGLFVLIVLAVIGGVFIMGQSKNNQPAQTQQTAQVSPTPEGVTVEVTQEASPSDETSPSGAATEGETKTFNVESSSYKFSLATITVKKGDTVKIVLTNKNGMHDWVVDEFNASTKVLQAGQTDTIEFAANKAGTFEYYCSVGNHRQMGMVGKLIVQ